MSRDATPKADWLRQLREQRSVAQITKGLRSQAKPKTKLSKATIKRKGK